MPAPSALPQPERMTPIRDREQVAAIVRAVVRATEAWGLTNAEGAALFDVPVATWNRMKAESFNGNLDQDKVTRASLLIGIYKGLRLLFNGPLTFGWVRTDNAGPLFGGRSPAEIMMRGGIPAMMQVRQHIDALRGGN